MHRSAILGVWLCLVSLPAAVQGSEFVMVQIDHCLYRGTTPTTDADFEKLKKAGVRTIIDLRGCRVFAIAAEKKLAQKHGIDYHNENCGYTPWPWSMSSAEKAYAHLLRKEEHPIYIHCNKGRDRTGLVVALYRVRCQEWAPRKAFDEMMRLGRSFGLFYVDDYFWDNCYAPGKGQAPAKPAQRDAAKAGP